MEIKKRKNLLVIGIVTLVVVLLGSTYAFFMYSKTIKAFTLTSNSIKAEFESGSNSVNMAYAYPISDAFAKQNLDKLGYVDFTVKGSVSDKKEAVTYEIYLTEDSNNTLDSSFIKVYLTDDTNKEVVSPSIYNSLPAPTLKSASDGKVILAQTETGTFESKYRIYVWIDSSYEQNEVNQTFSFKVNLYAYNDVPTMPKATEVVKATIGKSNGVIGITNENKSTTDKNSDIREYRYSGQVVDNYVYYNCDDIDNQDKSSCELWRIIGVFKDENGIELLKIVRNDNLNSDYFPETYTINDTIYKISDSGKDRAFWNYIDGETESLDWTKAGIQYWLNTESDDSKTNKGYLNFLKTYYKNMIEETTYYLGNIEGTADYYGAAVGTITTIDSTIQAYQHEHSGDKWTGKIGLIYPSDLGFSTIESGWVSELYVWQVWHTYMFDEFANSWIFNTLIENDIDYDNDSYSTMSILTFDKELSNGPAFYFLANELTNFEPNIKDSYYIQPTLYLKNEIKISNGTGSLTNPYWLQ